MLPQPRGTLPYVPLQRALSLERKMFQCGNCYPKHCIVPLRSGLGDPRGTAWRAGARPHPLADFFRVFLAGTRKTPAGGSGTGAFEPVPIFAPFPASNKGGLSPSPTSLYSIVSQPLNRGSQVRFTPRRLNVFSSTLDKITEEWTSQPRSLYSCSIACSAFGSVAAQMERAISTSSV